jgi:hypothetical protein
MENHYVSKKPKPIAITNQEEDARLLKALRRSLAQTHEAGLREKLERAIAVLDGGRS